MLNKIKAFLYLVTHASGRLLDLTVNLGPFHSQLWVGREDPNTVSFAVEAECYYGPYGTPSLAISVRVGVIQVELILTRSSSG
ncbi:hypothetical protein LCGC14_3093540 [marine sediment metagenome]|uniref:Uncharacterized protein n=1 Tax=marine sediment metagenome TaxID=412755 RepID=A0A0F8YH99_9ZZZZ